MKFRIMLLGFLLTFTLTTTARASSIGFQDELITVLSWDSFQVTTTGTASIAFNGDNVLYAGALVDEFLPISFSSFTRERRKALYAVLACHSQLERMLKLIDSIPIRKRF